MPEGLSLSRESVISLLQRSGQLDAGQLERARRAQAGTTHRLEEVLTQLGLVTERQLAEAYGVILGTPVVMPGDFPDRPALEGRFSKKFLKRTRTIPLHDSSAGLAVAMADPLDDAVARALAFAAKKPVIRRVAFAADIDAAHERLYGETSSATDQSSEPSISDADEGWTDDIERLKDLASDAPVIRLVNSVIARAVESRASDIHFESTEDCLRIRYRIDGVLHDVESAPARQRAAIISRIKLMAKLNIAERRLAQDGRIRLAIRGRDIDFRVATNPAIQGESVVLRILDRSSLKLDFAALGFDEDILPRYLTVLRQPHGILLVTGPTGSGKTTTLYTSLLTLNTGDRKILTVEDPVEYLIAGINQVQVKPNIGLTFASALRSFLRQDPDIMMVGEIRDLETAQIAVQAALTGHLVLSTVHTNDAASAVTRLLDMGVEDYLLTSTVNALVAQRLVRTLCTHCREPFEPLPDLIERLGLDRLSREKTITLYRPRGCDHCGGTGYFGRTMILELLVIDDAIRPLILKHAEAREIQAAAVAHNMQTMWEHGIRKALAGITTTDEVVRAVRTL
jgi:general secretion pathway protein E